MKQTLEFKLGQHLTITPQLQQAIRLLQLSTLELQQEIQEALESNPLLEEDDNQSQDDSTTKDEASNEDSWNQETRSLEPTDTKMDSVSSDDSDTMSYEQEWQNTNEGSSSASVSTNSDDFPDIDARNSAPETLSDHLSWQVQMSQFSARDQIIALALIDSINEDGYLSTDLADMQQTLNKSENEEPYELDEIQAVLHRIHNFDPIGVGARNLAECLQIQLRFLEPDTPYLEEARQLANPEHLESLANRDIAALRRKLKLSVEQVQGALHLIKFLNPKPGGGINATQAPYIAPDIVVRKRKGVWRAELNAEMMPRVRINSTYERLIQNKKPNPDKKYIQEQLQQAKWFIKSLKSRNETLLKVARTIVDRQRAFLEHGAEAMKPLVLHDIAETVEMHESTISRVTTNKYMLTPQGIFELKFFFSSHVTTVDGGTCSATAIRSIIKKLVGCEPASKPISDSKIANILEEQGIHVARRTVAKYRESMRIPPSNQRKAII